MHQSQSFTVPALKFPLITATRMRAHVRLFVRVLQTLAGFRDAFAASIVAASANIAAGEEGPDSAEARQHVEDMIHEMVTTAFPLGLGYAVLQHTQSHLSVQSNPCPDVASLRLCLMQSVLDLHFPGSTSGQASFEYACHIAVVGVRPQEQGIWLTKLILATIHDVGRPNLHRLSIEMWLKSLAHTAFEIPMTAWSFPQHSLTPVADGRAGLSRQALADLRKQFARQGQRDSTSGCNPDCEAQR